MDWNLQTSLAALSTALAIAKLVYDHWQSRRSSRLNDPAAFELPPLTNLTFVYDSTSPLPDHHLVGRERDVEALVAVVRKSSLVWVIGRSGVGKSTLLRCGLAPALFRSREFMPVILESWGADWAKGPLEALADSTHVALAGGLEESAAKSLLAGESSVSSENVFDILGRMRAATGRHPVVILDQLDEYMQAHRMRFLDTDSATLVNTAVLRSHNLFWDRLARGVEAGTIRVLYAARSETAGLLEAIRLRDPATYELTGLDPEHVVQLIERLSQGNVILNRENGFDDLKEDLAARFGEQDGPILPIQVRVALAALSSLPDLTRSSLQSAGGIPGLQAHYVSRQLKRLKRHYPNADRVMLYFVTRTDGEAKTTGHSKAEIDEAFPDLHVYDLLEQLEGARLIRRETPHDGTEVWTLYHDYLGASLVEYERRNRLWERTLDDANHRFHAVRGIRAKWRALLSPEDLYDLICARFRGDVHFKRRWALLLLSPARAVLGVRGLLLIAFTMLFLDYNSTRYAEQEAALIDESGPARGLVAGPLWQLTKENYTHRQKTLAALIATPSGRRRFLSNRDGLVLAIAGLSEKEDGRLTSDVLVPHCYRQFPKDDLEAASCAALSRSIDSDMDRVLDLHRKIMDKYPLAGVQVAAGLTEIGSAVDPPLARKAVNAIWSSIQRNTNAIAQVMAVSTLEQLCRQLRGDSALAIANELLTRLEAATPQQAFWLGRLLAGIVPHLGPREESEVSARLLATASKIRGPNLRAVATVLPTFGSSVAADTIHTFADRLLDDLAHADSLDSAAVFASAVASLQNGLRHDQEARFFELAFRALDNRGSRSPTDALESRALLFAMIQLRHAASARDMSRVSADLHHRISRSENLQTALQLAEGLCQMGPQLDPETAESVIREVIAVGSRSVNMPSRFSSGLACLAKQVPGKNAARLAIDLSRLVPRSADSDTLKQLLMAIGAAASNSDPAVQSAIKQEMLDALEKAPANVVGAYARGLSSLNVRLSSSELDRVVAKILDAYPKTTNLMDLSDLELALSTFNQSVSGDARMIRFQVSRSRNLNLPPCRALAPLFAEESVGQLLEVLKWPTCQDGDRALLFHRLLTISQADIAQFGEYTEVPGEAPAFSMDRLAVSRWLSETSRKNPTRFDLAARPQLPSALDTGILRLWGDDGSILMRAVPDAKTGDKR